MKIFFTKVIKYNFFNPLSAENNRKFLKRNFLCPAAERVNIDAPGYSAHQNLFQLEKNRI